MLPGNLITVQQFRDVAATKLNLALTGENVRNVQA